MKARLLRESAAPCRACSCVARWDLWAYARTRRLAVRERVAVHERDALQCDSDAVRPLLAPIRSSSVPLVKAV